ncbi:hypothetical protein GCM10027189_30130 [Rufibacter soli]
MYDFGFLKERLPNDPLWVFVRILLSGPGLVILGISLYVKYSYRIINKISGVLLILIGFYCLYRLIAALNAEPG